MAELIASLIEKKTNGKLHADLRSSQELFDPINAEVIHAAEKRLGFTVTPLIRRLYTEVSNGGFGPAYGLLGLVGGMTNEDGNDAVSQYLCYRQTDPDEPRWAWPSGLLPIGHLGCAMYMCVDCLKPTGPVIWFEPNVYDPFIGWGACFIPAYSSADLWLSKWLSGVSFFESEAENLLEVHLRKFGVME